MKRIVLLSAALLLVASASYAPCWWPEWRHVDYWQFHQGCAGNPPRCVEDWSLDGTCDYYCDGSSYCQGDTEIRYRTMLELQSGQCDMVCE